MFADEHGTSVLSSVSDLLFLSEKGVLTYSEHIDFGGLQTPVSESVNFGKRIQRLGLLSEDRLPLLQL